MTDASAPGRHERIVRHLVGDGTVQCVAVPARDGRVVIVVNEQFPGALAHAERHLDDGESVPLLCAPECDGT